MPQDLLQIAYQAGPTALVAVVAIWALTKKNNKNNNSKQFKKAIDELQTNHLSTLDNKMDRVEEKLDQVISLLIEIKTRLLS